MMIVVEATDTCRWLMIFVKAYFTSVHLLVHYTSVKKKNVMNGYGTYKVDKTLLTCTAAFPEWP